MLVLLHGGDPGDIVKCDDAQTEIGVIRDFDDFFKEGREIGRGDIIYSGDKVGCGEAVLVGGGAAGLWSGARADLVFFFSARMGTMF